MSAIGHVFIGSGVGGEQAWYVGGLVGGSIGLISTGVTLSGTTLQHMGKGQGFVYLALHTPTSYIMSPIAVQILRPESCSLDPRSVLVINPLTTFKPRS